MDKTNNRQVLARKWRPRDFKSVLGQEHVVTALSNALEQNFLHHAYLFTGTRGVGKTTIARILAKCLNCESGITAAPCGTCSNCQEIDSNRFPDLFEIDAASRTKVEDTREILNNVQYSPVKGRFKIYLIDEVHMLSGHSFNALLKTLEEPPEHVKFLLATTDPQKLPATVLSRCLQFHLTHMSSEQINGHLQSILEQENIEFEADALNLISKAANGSVRDSLSLLDQGIAFGKGQVLSNNVKAMLGTVDESTLLDILSALHEKNAEAILTLSEKLAAHGNSFQQALNDILSLLHNISLAQFVPNSTNDKNITLLANNITKEDVQLYYQIGLIGQRDLPFAPNAKIGFEMTLLRMMAFTPNGAPETKHHSSIKQPLSQKTTAKTLQSPAPNADQWTSLLSQLRLTGATNALAQACALEKLDDSSLHLQLSPSHQALLNQKHIDRIKEALKTHFGKPMDVKINIQQPQQPTAKQALDAKKQEKLEKATTQIKQDNNVQGILKTFDATVINDSISTIEDSN